MNSDKQNFTEPSLRKSGFAAWLDNFMYHYKTQSAIAAGLIITIVICTIQMINKDKYDYYLLYAGPQILAVQDITYIRSSAAKLADDYDGDGKVNISLDDVVMLSPEELEAAKADGAVLDGNFLKTTMTEYYQQMLAGDAVICLLSPYMYEIVHRDGGFLPLAEIFPDDPSAYEGKAYDDCGILLHSTDFGTYFNGINDLPADTILCIRRLSTFKNLKGSSKTEAHHAACLNLFRTYVTYSADTGE